MNSGASLHDIGEELSAALAEETQFGKCKCGCGGDAPIAKSSRRGHVKGQPVDFIHNHHGKGVHRTTRRVEPSSGYVIFREGGVGRHEHVVVAERVLGKPLPKGAVVHHVNRNRADNRPENLVICPSHAYHRLLHQRMSAQEACGNPNWRMCGACKTWDDPSNLTFRRRASASHKSAGLCPTRLQRRAA